MNDEKVRLVDLKRKVREFRKERGWVGGPWDLRNFAISLVLEAAEFLEHFQWKSGEDVLKDKSQKKEVAYELADVLYWVLAIADEASIDLSKTLEEKLKKQNKRYPVSAFSEKLNKKETLKRYYKLKNK